MSSKRLLSCFVQTHLYLEGFLEGLRKFYYRFMYMAPSSASRSLLTPNLPFEVILRRFEIAFWRLFVISIASWGIANIYIQKFSLLNGQFEYLNQCLEVLHSLFSVDEFALLVMPPTLDSIGEVVIADRHPDCCSDFLRNDRVKNFNEPKLHNYTYSYTWETQR